MKDVMALKNVYLLVQMHLVRFSIVFFSLQLTNSKVYCGSCREERSQRGFALLNTTYSSHPVQSYQDCVYLCADDPECMSFNFWWDSRKCDLNSKARELSCKTCFVNNVQARRRWGSRGSNKPPLEVDNGLKTQTVDFQLLANSEGHKLRVL